MSRWKRWVGAFARKARGVLGLSLIGGTIATIGGSIFTATVILLEFGMPFSREMPGLLAGMLIELSSVFFVMGAITTGGFATLLSVTSRKLTLSELSVPRAAITGGVIAMMIPIVAIAVAAGLPFALDLIIEGMPVWLGLGGAGAGISGGLVAIAKRAETRELSAADQAIAEIEA